ncbi:hypothetical protein FQV27_02930 [Paracoccus aurantiacus]|uniref:Uncharacterized protein n=1 Tax=Paracoccus aurantiacus TaxID=2599412 RepID=A0A5C6S8X0_9RHOB|nr:hypothetical protein [Paracoccus aurantiacus]TXB70824.1 hypothetical protein FQV27_02930 [Paracoccus aurantiacus]
MNFAGVQPTSTKPGAPWSAAQLLYCFIARLLQENFHVICPDNEVTPQLGAKRMRCATEDMIQSRPALSRWHPGWKARFADRMTK